MFQLRPGPSAAADRPDRIASVLFTTQGLPPSQRLGAWQAQFEALNTVTVEERDRTRVAVRNENWVLGGMMFSTNTISRARFTRGAREVRRTGLDHWVIRVVRQGRNSMEVGGATHALQPGRPFLFALDQRWVCDWDDAEWLSLCIPRDAFPDLSAGLAGFGAGPLEGAGSSLLSDYLVLLEHRLRTGTAEEVPALAEATRAMLTACLLRGTRSLSVAPADIRAAQMERIRGLIRTHIASPALNAARLARMAGMSRSVLYRLLEPHGGVASYIQAQRLRLVHALLCDAALAAVPIGALAERAGFFDASSFSRMFRTTFGYAPRDARAAALAGMPLSPVAPEVAGNWAAGDFGALLRRLNGGGALPAPGGTEIRTR